MSRTTYDLAALQAKSLPRCTFATLAAALHLTLVPEGEAKPEEVAEARAELEKAIDAQVHPFIPPQEECVGCGSILASTHFAKGMLLSTFRYGLVHGEGYCGNCGYPSRRDHWVPKGSSGLRFQRVLQYHPDELAAPATV